MDADARLNLLLTPSPAQTGAGQPWQQTVSRLLVPLGVRTFEAKSGAEAVELMERHPIHLAVVDTRLPAISGLNVCELIQRLRDHGQRTQVPTPQAETPGFEFRMQVEEKSENGQTQ